MSVIKLLKEHQDTDSRAHIAQYIIEHLEELDLFTSTFLSKQCHVSQPTIVRFAKSLGFDGFSQFKYALCNELQQRTMQQEFISARPFLVKTSQMIIENSESDITSFLNVVKSCSGIVLCCPSILTNFSNSLAEDLNSVGKPTICISLEQALLGLKRFLTSQDVFLYISKDVDVDKELLLFDSVRACDSVALKITNRNHKYKTADCTIKIDAGIYSGSDIMFKSAVQTFLSYLCIHIESYA